MTATAREDVPSRAGRKEYLALAVLGLPTILISLDVATLLLALPHLSTDLGATAVQQLWISDLHVFMVAAFLVTAGNLGDRLGRRRLLFGAAALFCVAAVLGATASSPEVLIASRALIGVAEAGLIPSVLALVNGMFRDRRQHGRAIAIWMGCYMGGTALGPVLGGALLERFWWGSVFLLGLPVMAVLLLAGPKLLPELRTEGAPLPDLASVLLSLAAILPLIYGLKELSWSGIGALPLASVAVGATCLALFLRRQRTAAHPLLDLSLFSDRTISAAISITALSGIVSGSSLFTYLYLQTVQGLDPFTTALWMLPSTFATIVSIQLVPLLTRVVRPGTAIAGGMVLVAAGYAMLNWAEATGGLALVITALVVSAIGTGPMAALCAHLVLRAAPLPKVGVAASLNETAGQLGLATGFAVLGLFGSAAYRSRMTETLPPGLPPETAAAAQDSVAGALTATEGLDPGSAGALISAAFDGVASSLGAAATASCVIALVAAAVAAIALRHVPAEGHQTDHGADTDVPATDENRIPTHGGTR